MVGVFLPMVLIIAFFVFHEAAPFFVLAFLGGAILTRPKRPHAEKMLTWRVSCVMSFLLGVAFGVLISMGIAILLVYLSQSSNQDVPA